MDEQLIKQKRTSISNEDWFGVVEALNRCGFEGYFAANANQAAELFWEELFPDKRPLTVSYGDSLTLKATGLLEALKQHPDVTFIETFEAGMSRAEKTAVRRDALQSHLFLTGTNALTQDGCLVNLDMTGNRVGGLTFGPERVVVFVGINKICDSLESAMKRVRTIAAPQNARRHTEFNTPCQKTGVCMNCSSEYRICNVWTITERCFPKKRIAVVLIGEEIGF